MQCGCGRGPPGADRAFHVAGDPLVGAAHVERRLVRAVQRPDRLDVAGPPVRHVALGPRVGAPEPGPGGERAGRARSVQRGDVRQRLAGAGLRLGRGERRVALGRHQRGQHALLLRPGRADHALALRQRVLPGGPPERLVVRRHELGRPRVPLPAQRGEPVLADAGDREVARRAGGDREHHRVGVEQLARVGTHAHAATRSTAISATGVDSRTSASSVGHPQRDRGRALGHALVLPDLVVVGAPGRECRRRPRSCARRRTGWCARPTRPRGRARRAP